MANRHLEHLEMELKLKNSCEIHETIFDVDIQNTIGYLKGNSGFPKCETRRRHIWDYYSKRLIVLSAGPSVARKGPSHLYPEPECRIPREIATFRAYFGLRGSKGTRDANLRRISQIVVGAGRKRRARHTREDPIASKQSHRV